MADPVDEVRSYCERVVKIRQRHSFGIKPETVAQKVLDLLGDQESEGKLTHNVFDDDLQELRVENDPAVNLKDQITGKR